jgi:hypothetical protein
MKKTKPSYHHFRPAEFLADMQGQPPQVVGTTILLNAHAWHRWNPEEHEYPSVPDDDELLRKLCNRPRNWHREKSKLLSKMRNENGRWYYPPHREDALRLTRHQERKKAMKQKDSTTKKAATKFDQLIAKQQADEQREKKERELIASVNQTAAATPEPEPQRSWDEAPAAEVGKIVYGLQGYRAIGWPSFSKLLTHPSTLKQTECVMWTVTDKGTEKQTVKVRMTGKRFTVTLANGQILCPD